MEDKSALITIKEEIPEDQWTETNQFGVYEEHNYNKNMSGDDYYYSQLHNSINIKEESDYNFETENSCSSEIVPDVHTQESASNYCDSRQQIKAEKCAFNLKTLRKDKAMGTENSGCSAILLTEFINNQFINIIQKEVSKKSSRKQQIFKKENFDYELSELHHSINIKGEVEFMETENAVQENDYNSDTVRPILNSQYPILNNKHSKNNTQDNLKLRNLNYKCSVVGCSNAYFNSDVKFYGFPNKWYEKERKKMWINFVKKTLKIDSKESWFPKPHSKICSDHFVGHERSNNSFSPSYIPTIYPTKI